MIAVIIWISRPFMIKLKDKGTRNDLECMCVPCMIHVWRMYNGNLLF